MPRPARNPLAGLSSDDRERLWDELACMREAFDEDGRPQLTEWTIRQQIALCEQARAETALLDRLEAELAAARDH